MARVIRSLILSLVISSILFDAALAIGGCDFGQADILEFLIPAKECLDEHPTNQLCWMKCFGMRLGMVDENGNVHMDAVETHLNKIPPGKLKNAFIKAKNKCAKEKVDNKKAYCQGYLGIGLCIRKILVKSCPEMMQIFKQ